MNLFYLSTHSISFKMRKKRDSGKRNGKLRAPGMPVRTQNTESFGDVDKMKINAVSSLDDGDNLVLKLYDEHEESEIDLFLCSKKSDWLLQFFDSQVESYELLAPGLEDNERIIWIKNIYYVLQTYLAHGASTYDSYVRSQWTYACRMELEPTWSGDSVEDFHIHLRRWDTDRLEEPDSEEADEGEGVGLSRILPTKCDIMVSASMVGCFGQAAAVESVAAPKPAGVLRTCTTAMSSVMG